MNHGPRRVVIPGVGAVTPVGHSTSSSWESILAGKSGFANASYQVDISDMPIGGVCEVKEWDAAEKVGRKESRRMDRCQQFVHVATQEAMAQSGLILPSPKQIYFENLVPPNRKGRRRGHFVSKIK